MGEESIDERASFVAVGRMNDEASGFGEDEDILIFVVDVEGHGLGLDGGGRRHGDEDFDWLAEIDAMATEGEARAGTDVAFLDELTRLAAGDLGAIEGDSLV